jgi:hypothetical protein
MRDKGTLLVLMLGLVTLLLSAGSVAGWLLGIDGGEMLKIVTAPAVTGLVVAVHSYVGSNRKGE